MSEIPVLPPMFCLYIDIFRVKKCIAWDRKIPMIARGTNTTASASDNETDKVISFIDYKDESQLEHVDKLVACDRK